MVDKTADATLRFQGFRRGAIMLGRALTLRCPNCGARGILASWFKLAPACPRCDLMLRPVVPNDLVSPSNTR